MRSSTQNQKKLSVLTQPMHYKTEFKQKSLLKLPFCSTNNRFDSTSRLIKDSLLSPKAVLSHKNLGSPQEKLSQIVMLSQSEKSLHTFRIPTLQLKSKKMLKTPKASYSFSPTDFQLTPNRHTVFIIKCPIPDLFSFRAIQCKLADLTYKSTTKDIYMQREQVIKEIQIKLKVPKQYHQLSLSNNQPIQFFQEIPEACNLIFLSCSTKQDYWNLIFQFHQYPYSKEKLNKLLNIISQINLLEDLQKLLTDKDTFHSYMEFKQLESFDPFLTEIKPEYQKTESLYRSSKHYEKTLMNGAQIEIPEEKVKLAEIGIINSLEEIEKDKDFSILRSHPQPCKIQEFLNKEGLSNQEGNRAPSRYLKLPNYKNQYSKVLKNQTFRSRHENQFTNFADHIARKLPPMTSYNIPKLMQETGLDRLEIYEVYSRYKALLSYECSQIQGMTKQMVPNGISKEAFNAGLDELSMAPQGVIDQLFNFFAKQNCLSFEGFLNAINLIKAKRNDNKIELILKLIDENENGLLSYEEIRNRCTLMMEDTLKDYDSELSINNMVEYITRSIFDAVKMPYDEEIPIDMIRKLIESKSQEAKFLIMMCCGDVNFID